MLKKNLFANYLGYAWSAFMGFAFIPYYINYLGIENYGLIGFFVIIQGALMLLDMGMTPALGRESAKYVGGGLNRNEFKLLIRTYEIIACIIFVLAFLIVFLTSEEIVKNWMNLDTVSQKMRVGRLF